MNAHSFRSIFCRRNLAPLTFTFLFLLVAMCGFVASGAQQSSPPEEEREVVDKIPKHLPIKLKVKKPEKVKDLKNEEWLGELEVEVTNTGTKPLYFLGVILRLPDVFAPNGLKIGWVLRYGRSELISFREPVRPDDVPILPGEGGNADGVIDERDRVFSSLRLWRDANHDGVSETEELHTLQSLDVARIHLDYKESRKADAFGNQFRYRAKVDDARGAKAGRWAWDVFLLSSL